eukprot:1789252-Rhodomonas_salina.7
MSGTEIAYGVQVGDSDAPPWEIATMYASCLRACYAMSGTGIQYCHVVYCASCLRACYAMSGTGIQYCHAVYCASCLRACYAMSSTVIAYAVVYQPTRVQCNVWYGSNICCAISQRASYAMPGIDVVHAATSAKHKALGRCPSGSRKDLVYARVPLEDEVEEGSAVAVCCPVSGTDIEYAAPCPVLTSCTVLLSAYAPDPPCPAAGGQRGLSASWYTICLRACYAMSGTDIAYAAAISLCACYTMYGTELAYAMLPAYARAMRCPVSGAPIHSRTVGTGPSIVLRVRYAMSGPIPYEICPVLSSILRTRYAMSGTNSGYATTRLWAARCKRMRKRRSELKTHRFASPLSAHAPPMRCPRMLLPGDLKQARKPRVALPLVLRLCYAVFGTDIPHTVSTTRCPVLTYCMASSAYTRAMRCPAVERELQWQAWAACYAICGTETAYGAGLTQAVAAEGISLRVRYAMPGTDMAYVLHTFYAMSGTNKAYAFDLPTRALRNVRYCYSVWLLYALRTCYAMSGTELTYGAGRGLCRMA